MKTLHRLFKIIDTIEKTGPLTQKELAQKLDYDKSLINRYTQILTEYGYFSKNQEGKIILGFRFLSLAQSVQNNYDILDNSRIHLRNLQNITKETIYLAELNGKTLYYIDKAESDHNIRLYSKIGETMDFHCTAIGKVILAYQDSVFVSDVISPEVLVQKTKNTITDTLALYSELDIIKRQGYAIDNEESIEGVRCLAAPIFDYRGSVHYAISISTLASRIDLETLLSYKRNLIHICEDISKRLGYNKN